MTKYRPYSRRLFQRRFRDWTRRNARLVVLLTIGVVALNALVAFVVTGLFAPTGLTCWALGASQMAVVAGYLHILHTAFLAHDAQAIRHLRGAWGEENTRDELRRARRKRVVWDWVDSITLQAGDIDHLVVTRQGGLVAIDSKWRSHASDTIDMARAAATARLRAEALAGTLLKGERGARHRSTANSLSVTSVVVLWGAAQHGVPDGARVDGTDFVAGRRLGEWLKRLEGQPVDKRAATDLVQRLEDFRATAWGHARASAR